VAVEILPAAASRILVEDLMVVYKKKEWNIFNGGSHNILLCYVIRTK
jgi:hypothetical protein